MSLPKLIDNAYNQNIFILTKIIKNTNNPRAFSVKHVRINGNAALFIDVLTGAVMKIADDKHLSHL